MIVEPIKNTGSSVALQARSSTEMPQKRLETAKPDQEQNLDRLKELASDAQKNLKIMHNVDLQFSVHEASGQIMVVVRDESTGKVIREIPPKEVLNLAAKFEEMAGMILDKTG
jgi:flagellar protein FlaG